MFRAKLHDCSELSRDEQLDERTDVLNNSFAYHVDSGIELLV